MTWSIPVNPLVEGCLFLATSLLFFAGLSFGAGDDPLTESQPWLVWRFTAAVGVGVAVLFFYRGCRAYLHLPVPAAGVGTGARVGYLVAASGLTVLVFGLLFLALVPERSWTIEHMQLRTGVVAASVGITAIPWLALILVAQKTLRNLRQEISEGRLRDGAAPITGHLRAWELITACLMAFGLFVAIALIPTGALRSLWLAHADQVGEDRRTELLSEATRQGGTAQEIEEATDAAVAAVAADVAARYSALDVLLYGAFFAIILAALTVPVLALWRTTAREIVERSLPLRTTDDVGDTVIGARDRLEKVLHLDTGLLRNPLTVFSILMPLLTSLLAAFVPELQE